MFLIQFKKYINLILILLLLTSCSEYQSLLKKGTPAEKYKAAEAYYKEGEFKKALRLFELVVPFYRGKPESERVLFYEADTYYSLRDYFISSYKFNRFVKSYPKSSKAEEADFKAARSMFELSGRYSLDQKETLEGINKLQDFINAYPESAYLKEANEYARILREKIERKYYSIAKQYHHRELYKQAIKAFDNYLLDYPGTKYTDLALYYRLESSYKLAINSFRRLIPERLELAKEHYSAFSKRAKDENLIKKAEAISEKIEEKKLVVN